MFRIVVLPDSEPLSDVRSQSQYSKRTHVQAKTVTTITSHKNRLLMKATARIMNCQMAAVNTLGQEHRHWRGFTRHFRLSPLAGCGDYHPRSAEGMQEMSVPPVYARSWERRGGWSAIFEAILRGSLTPNATTDEPGDRDAKFPPARERRARVSPARERRGRTAPTPSLTGRRRRRGRGYGVGAGVGALGLRVVSLRSVVPTAYRP